MRGGVGDRSFCLKNDRILPCFLFCGVALEPFAGVSTGISSSVDGGDERDESESTMVAVGRSLLRSWSWFREGATKYGQS